MYRGTLTTRAGRLAFVLLPLSLLACSGGGGDGDGAVEGMCQAIGGGASEFSATPAPNASFTNEGNIFDGDLGSFGTLETVGGAGSSTIQGTAQAGVVAPAGDRAGVLLQGAIESNTTMTVTTFLDGVVADSGPPLFSHQRGSYVFYGLHTTQPFDSIRVTFNLANSPLLDIHELCVSGG